MGYSHYWRTVSARDKIPVGSVTQDKWYHGISQCIGLLGYVRTHPKYSVDTPITVRKFQNDQSWKYLAVNGVGDNSHEDFVLPYESAHLLPFDCCKTNQKPYDKVVTACLCILANKGLVVLSDGTCEDWQDGYNLAVEFLGLNEASSFDLPKAVRFVG